MGRGVRVIRLRSLEKGVFHRMLEVPMQGIGLMLLYRSFWSVSSIAKCAHHEIEDEIKPLEIERETVKNLSCIRILIQYFCFLGCT